MVLRHCYCETNEVVDGLEVDSKGVLNLLQSSVEEVRLYAAFF